MSYPTSAQLAERRQWAQQFQSCWVCGSRVYLVTHEIGSRAQAPGKWCDVRNFIVCCNECNGHEMEWLSEEAQCGLKMLHDFENCDPAFICRIRGRAETAISREKVKLWESFFRKLRSA